MRRSIMLPVLVALVATTLTLAGWSNIPHAPAIPLGYGSANPSCGNQDNGTFVCQDTIGGLYGGGALAGDDEVTFPTAADCLGLVGYYDCWGVASGTTLEYASSGYLYTEADGYDTCVYPQQPLYLRTESRNSVGNGKQVSAGFVYGTYDTGCQQGHNYLLAGTHYRTLSGHKDGFYYNPRGI